MRVDPLKPPQHSYGEQALATVDREKDRIRRKLLEVTREATFKGAIGNSRTDMLLMETYANEVAAAMGRLAKDALLIAKQSHTQPDIFRPDLEKACDILEADFTAYCDEQARNKTPFGEQNRYAKGTPLRAPAERIITNSKGRTLQDFDRGIAEGAVVLDSVHGRFGAAATRMKLLEGAVQALVNNWIVSLLGGVAIFWLFWFLTKP